MAFKLPDLPFAKDALGEHISSETLDYHHGKHHQAYVDKTNGMLADHGLENASLLEVMKHAKDKKEQGLYNNSAQIWNHDFYWQSLSAPGSTKPSDKLSSMIDSDFGSKENLIKELKDKGASQSGSGWAWLLLNNGKLEVTNTLNADEPVTDGATPLLTVDVWEHAYYLDYQNARPDYLEHVLKNILNWEFASQNLDGKGAERANQQA